MIDGEAMVSVKNGDDKSLNTEMKNVVLNEITAEKGVNMVVCLRSRVVPYHDGEMAFVAKSNASENSKDVENLRSVNNLGRLKNQQSNLFNLLEKFIGSSQSGINSLETRVHGLKMAVNGISYDLAVSSGRFPNTDPAGSTCCKLPGAEFLSPKFWRKTKARYSTPRFSSSGHMHSLNTS